MLIQQSHDLRGGGERSEELALDYWNYSDCGLGISYVPLSAELIYPGNQWSCCDFGFDCVVG